MRHLARRLYGGRQRGLLTVVVARNASGSVANGTSKALARELYVDWPVFDHEELDAVLGARLVNH